MNIYKIRSFEMMIKKFEDLGVWKVSMNLSACIYQSLKDCKDFSIRHQLQRASLSIPSNIAEGFERKSNKSYIYFLHVAPGSCAEPRTQPYLAKTIGILQKDESNKMIEMTRKVSAMIYRLILSRQKF